MIDEVLAIDNVPLENVRAESLVRLLILCAPEERTTLKPEPMQTSSFDPGRILVLQLEGFCHRLLPPLPVHVTLHVATIVTDAVAESSGRPGNAKLVALIVTIADVVLI